MDNQKIVILSLLFALIFWTASCGNQEDINPTKNTQLSTSIKPTSSPTHTQEPTPSPTLALLPTYTPTIFIPTSLPTLSQTDIDQALTNLVETNGNCSLPCWWGIIPGETTWQEARQQLEQYNMDISTTGPTEIEIGNHKRIVDFYYVSIYLDEYPRGLGARIEVLDDTDITQIYTRGRSTGIFFHLHNLLEKYGKPKGVYIETNPNVPGDLLTLNIVLYYPDLSLGVGYDLPASLVDNNIIGCPQNETPKIWMWDPERGNDFTPEFIQEGMIGYGARNNFLTLEEATGLSIDEFHQEFKETYSLACLETLSEVWK